MPHKVFIETYQTRPLGFLISTQKSLGILLAHKIHDPRLQLFLLKWAAALILLLSAGICGFNLVPMFLALGLLSHLAGLGAFLLWLGSGDIFLQFALEDEGFYQLATQNQALCTMEDTDYCLPRPTN